MAENELRAEPGPARVEAGPAPAVSLILCTVGRTEPLARLFTSLVAQTEPDFEVVVVDQNPPGVLEPVLAPFAAGLRIHHCRAARGLSRARNIGLAQSRGAILAFPDDDCWYPSDLVERIMALFKATPGIDIHTGRTLDASGRESLGRFLPRDESVGKANVWFAGNSNSLFVTAAAARRVGGFDESLGVGAATRFKSGEETDFLLRLIDAGLEARFHRDLVVHHDQVLDDGPAALKRAEAYAPGFGRVLRLHHYGAIYLGLRLVRTLARAVIALLQGDLATAKYKLVWARGTALGYFSREPA